MLFCVDFLYTLFIFGQIHRSRYLVTLLFMKFHNFMETLGSAFSASALFLLGLRMVGQNNQRPGGGQDMTRTSLILPGLLITMKSLVLPVISREIVYQLDAGGSLNATTDLSNYAFLYGTIPTAPSVFVYAANYGILQDVTATAITASTFIAAPLMFVTAKLLTLMNMDPSKYIDQLDIFLLDINKALCVFGAGGGRLALHGLPFMSWDSLHFAIW